MIFLGFSGLSVFAEDDNGDEKNQAREHHGEDQPNSMMGNQSNAIGNQTSFDDRHESENRTIGDDHRNKESNINEHQSEDENKTKNDNDQNKTMSEDMMKSHEDDLQEIEHQKENEHASHRATEHESSRIDDAKSSRTIAAEVEIGNGQVDHKSIDNNINVNTEQNSTNDSVNITVSATNQTGPKVILVNLNSTTIDVSSIKYLHVHYDGQLISPADNVDQVLNATSSDVPHYAILITQNGAQILISIPHFSTHTITLDSLSKVIPAIPEFPLSAILVFAFMTTLSVVFSRKILHRIS